MADQKRIRLSDRFPGYRVMWIYLSCRVVIVELRWRIGPGEWSVGAGTTCDLDAGRQWWLQVLPIMLTVTTGSDR